MFKLSFVDILLRFCHIITIAFLFGCSSTQFTPVSVGRYQLERDQQIFIKQPISSAASSSAWNALRSTHQQIAAVDHEFKSENLHDSITVQIGQAHILYQTAIEALQAAPYPDKAAAAEALSQALEIISEILSQPNMVADQKLSRLALYAVQAYDDHIQRLSELDGEAPALVIYERLFGNPENTIVDEDLFLGILLPKTEIPLELNYQVKRFITFYSTRFHDIFQRYLNRAEIYFPMMQDIIEEENVPPEIIYLTIVESGVNPHARSRANAVGAWQFIKSTGRMFDLHGNVWFDERQNIAKSTRSAMRLLKSLYRRYGDWYLALAAYNAGTGKVNRAIRRSGKKNFWGITRYLRRETRQYVPRYIAASIIAMHPEHFGFKPLVFAEVEPTEEVLVPNCMPLDLICEHTGLSKASLKFLNPELRKEVTPPAYRNYPLRVPKELAATVKHVLDSIPDSEQLFFTVYKSKRRESIAKIAKKVNLKPSILQQLNNLRSSVVPRGKTLVIPTSPEAFAETSYSIRELADDSRERRRRRYRRRKPRPEATFSLVPLYRKFQKMQQKSKSE